MGLDYKLVFSLIGILINLVGYYYYIRNIFSKNNKPHIFSWLVWSTLLFIGFAIQYTNNGGYGSFVTFVEAILCFSIVIIAIKKGEKNITKLDKYSLIGAFFSLLLWLIFKQPLLSVLLLILIDFLGFIPTFTKAYIKPYEESMSVYITGTIIFTFAFIGLKEYSFLTYGYPIAIAVLDATMLLMILYRRKIFKKNC